MLPIYVALVCETDSIPAREFTRVAAALDKQVTRDFGPQYGVFQPQWTRSLASKTCQ
jgi:hypothetical protein